MHSPSPTIPHLPRFWGHICKQHTNPYTHLTRVPRCTIPTLIIEHSDNPYTHQTRVNHCTEWGLQHLNMNPPKDNLTISNSTQNSHWTIAFLHPHINFSHPLPKTLTFTIHFTIHIMAYIFIPTAPHSTPPIPQFSSTTRRISQSKYLPSRLCFCNCIRFLSFHDHTFFFNLPSTAIMASWTWPFELSLPFSNFPFQHPLRTSNFYPQLRPPSRRGNFVFNCFTFAPMRPRRSKWQKLSSRQVTPNFVSTPLSKFPYWF